MSDDIEYGVYSLPAALMLQHKLDEQVVTALNDYLDDLRSNEERKSAADSLVGQIHHGEQLQMDVSHPDLARFIKIVESLSIVYLKHFVEQTRSQLRPKRVATDKLWSVHSFAGDYNPIHDHTTTAPMGISFTTWTMVPEQITKTDDSGSIDLYNNSGNIDGFINFTYGLNQTADPERLRPSQSRYIKPQVGLLLMFPSWMQHCVYPFQGDGERRTVAGNINCFDLTQDEIQEKLKNE